MKQVNVIDGKLNEDNLDKLILEAETSKTYGVLHGAGYYGQSSEGINFFKYSWPVYKAQKDDEIPPIFKEMWEDVQKHLDFNAKLHRIYINAHTYGVEDSIHTDDVEIKKGYTAIVYLCRGWNAEWAGQTTFYSSGDPMEQDILYSVLPRPNRLLVFDKDIPHSVSPISRRFTGVRLSCMFKIEKLDDENKPS